MSIKNCKGYRQDLMMNLMLFQENIADIYDIDIALSGKLSNFKSHRPSPIFHIIFISLN